MKQKTLKSSFCKATGFIAQCPGRYSVALIQDLVLTACFIGAKVRSTESDPQPRHLLPPGAVRLCCGEECHPSDFLPARPARLMWRCRQKPGGLCAVVGAPPVTSAGCRTEVPLCCPAAADLPGRGRGYAGLSSFPPPR